MGTAHANYPEPWGHVHLFESSLEGSDGQLVQNHRVSPGQLLRHPLVVLCAPQESEQSHLSKANLHIAGRYKISDERIGSSG